MSSTTNLLGIDVHLSESFDAAIGHVIAALKAENFGVLTVIDVKDTLKQKIGVDFRPYRILGACNPQLAYRALTVAPDVGLLLPCNVTVSQAETGGTDVSLVDPLAMLGFVGHPALEPIAQEARTRLERVAAALSS